MTDRSELRELVRVYLDRTAEGEDSQAVEAELREAHPTLASGLERALRSLRSAGFEHVARVAGTPDQLGEFQLQQRIGGGGMGVVYRARQASVDRTVALKVIRADHLYLDGARQRFQREAEAVARLAHPGIAALFAVGEEGGVPYCAMEFIPGASLDVALRQLVGHRVELLTGTDLRQAVAVERHGDAPSSVVDPGFFEGTWTATCLRIVRDTAKAVDHAHERGVLHRDIKPSNVMVTRGGRVVLLDFGLAGLREGNALTQTGAALGSMPYMAPEQAAGRTRYIDERTDVYGLGVLLYELLTLRPPFAGREIEAVRGAILAGTHLALRKLNAGIPRDVEIVVERAMDLDRDRRYASAEALARDLSNLLERRPIDARPAGPLLRLDRLVRRRPAAALAVLFAAILLVGGPLTFGWLQGRHARRLGQALDETEAHLSSALSAVSEVLRPLSSEGLMDTPGLQALRVRLFRQALDLVQGIAERRPDDARVRLEHGRIDTGLGQALIEQGQQQAGLQHLRAGEALLAQLAAESTTTFAPDTPAVMSAWIECRIHLGVHLHLIGELEESWTHLDGAMSGARTLVDEDRSDPDRVLLLARTLGKAGLAHKEEGHADAALALIQEAQDRALRAVDLAPERADAHAGLGESILLESRLYEAGQGSLPWPSVERERKLAQALASFRRARELQPESRSIALGLFNTHRDLGGAATSDERWSDAKLDYEAALYIANDLATRFPEVEDYRARRLEVLQMLAILANRSGDPHGALAAHEEVAAAHIDLAELEGTPGPAHLGAVVAACNTAGQALNMDDLEEERFERAERWLLEARRLFGRMPAGVLAERQSRIRVYLPMIESSLASERGDPERAMERLQRAESLVEKMEIPLAAGLTEGWGVLLDQLPADDPRRHAARESAVRLFVVALDLGLPAAQALKGDYFKPLAEDPRVVQAIGRQQAASANSGDSE